MPDEKDLSPLSWHIEFLEFHYLFSNSSFIFRRLNNVETLFKYLSLVKQKIDYTQGVKLPVPRNAIFLSVSCYFSACLQIITRALIAADEEAPPLNRTTVSSVGVVCKRKVCIGSSDPDLSVLFEFAQLKQGPQMGAAPFWFYLFREKKNPCVWERYTEAFTVTAVFFLFSTCAFQSRAFQFGVGVRVWPNISDLGTGPNWYWSVVLSSESRKNSSISETHSSYQSFSRVHPCLTTASCQAKFRSS